MSSEADTLEGVRERASKRDKGSKRSTKSRRGSFGQPASDEREPLVVQVWTWLADPRVTEAVEGARDEVASLNEPLPATLRHLHVLELQAERDLKAEILEASETAAERLDDLREWAAPSTPPATFRELFEK